ncbi:Phosphotransferase enzyme family protein [Geodermatophilus aquaeductus]|uniref:Phosphotransferase enzyme family protein n=1 Tax=Geodermatophilus aquaeductus TaxID=1564161 RepID=A0A521BME6_9ACTN|nr:phosphotransferase [Geodermatophilus aquaeductus]SMO48279.1 Phosphotransferase enzyme family protein [Geodermatophilus aquaeductus]
MTTSPVTFLPGGTTPGVLLPALRRWTGDRGLEVDDVDCRPLPHDVSAPTTRGLTRVRITGRDGSGAPVELRLVAKELQSARYGLPPQMPDDARAHLDVLIPWRLEADVLASGVADDAPPGLRPPAVVAVEEQPEDRLTLWLEDADPVEAPWTAADTERAAEALGRLAARRRGRPTPSLPGGDFLTTYRDEQLGTWAVPWLLDDATWATPLFGVPEVAALRDEVCGLARRVDDVHARLAPLPVLPAHGDATPMNLLRPAAAPDTFVLVDWAMTGPAPAGFDVVPLVFGRAECGLGPADEVPALLGPALAGYARGLADEGVDVPLADLETAVLAAALLRYPCTGMPLHVLFEPVTDELLAYAARRARFVRMVLDLEPRLTALSGR